MLSHGSSLFPPSNSYPYCLDLVSMFQFKWTRTPVLADILCLPLFNHIICDRRYRPLLLRVANTSQSHILEHLCRRSGARLRRAFMDHLFPLSNQICYPYRIDLVLTGGNISSPFCRPHYCPRRFPHSTADTTVSIDSSLLCPMYSFRLLSPHISL
jgi:hypothetical protein